MVLSYSDKRIIHRNEQEIKALQARVTHALKDIKELRKQNREILGRE